MISFLTEFFMAGLSGCLGSSLANYSAPQQAQSSLWTGGHFTEP
jgi:hypothetical protein